MDSSASVRLVIWSGKFIDVINHLWLNNHPCKTPLSPP
ncbi:hypothetical protein AO375_0510 [Moraxella catarrhalis]|nr:hypothetical protein AO375_0510 [Moraxella catarrhalis]